MLRRIVDGLHKVTVAACGLALAVMVLVVAYQILGRYVPFISRALWTEEISRLCLVWLIFLGAAAGLRTSEHFVIDLVPRGISDRAQRILITLGSALIAAVAVMLFIGGISFVETGIGRISTTSNMPLAFSFAAIPFSSVLMLIFTVSAWVEGMRRPQEVSLITKEIAKAETLAATTVALPETLVGKQR